MKWLETHKWGFHFSLVSGDYDYYVNDDSSRSLGKRQKELRIYVEPKYGKVDIPLEVLVFTHEDAGAWSPFKLLGTEAVQDSGVPTLSPLWAVSLPIFHTPLHKKHANIQFLACGQQCIRLWDFTFHLPSSSLSKKEFPPFLLSTTKSYSQLK